MNLQQIAEKYSIKNRIEFSRGQGELDCAKLTHPDGSSAEIYLQGSQITSWKTANQQEQLFVGSRAVFAPGKAIRGGVPIIWPQFNNRGPLPPHGFARTSLWQVVKTSVLVDGSPQIKLSLEANPQTRAIWPHEFKLECCITLNQKLSLDLHVTNPSTQPFTFTAALHSYFVVSDISQVSISGLQGIELVDFLKGNQQSIENRDAVKITEFTDRAYHATPKTLKISDHGKQQDLIIEKTGFADAVVWNPWIDRCREIKDLAPEDYKAYVCVEAAQINQAIEVLPGADYQMRQVLSVRDL